MTTPRGTLARLRTRPGAMRSLRALVAMGLLAVFAEMIASPLPLVGRIQGQLYVLPNVFVPATLAAASRADLEARALPGDFAFGPLLHFGPYDVDRDTRGGARATESPSWRHPFGTDVQGRDLLARVLYGTRTAFAAAVVAVSAQLLLGATLGAFAGLVGGVFDGLLTRLIEALTAVPLLLLLVAVQALVPHPSLTTLLVAYAATRWTEVARLVRVEVMRVSQSDYVLAARGLGATPLGILLRHIAPNARSPLLVAASLGIADLVLAEASADFLGVGSPPAIASWGESLSEARHHASAWWLLAYPGLAIFVTLLILHRLGDAFREALDPNGQNAASAAKPDS